MAESIMDMLDISQEIIDKVKPEEVYEGKTIDSGLYEATVKTAYIRKTDSGANMLEVDFILPPKEGTTEPTLYHYSNCVKSGDEKGNKTTYTDKRSGKEIPLPGVVAFTKFLESIGSVGAKAIEGQVKHKDDTIKALCINDIQGKKLMIGLIQEENLWNGNTTIKNDVKYWLDDKGENSKGDDLRTKVKESIEKFPLKKLKASQTASTPTPSDGTGSEADNSGW